MNIANLIVITEAAKLKHIRRATHALLLLKVPQMPFVYCYNIFKAEIYASLVAKVLTFAAL